MASLALLLSALFAGAALYVSFVEDPARATLDDAAALREWQPSYKRGAIMQASLAVVAFLAGLAAWWQSGNLIFALGALFQILPWPWTLLVIMPTNRALLKLTPDQAGPESRALLKQWGRLHAMRTLLGCAATLAFLAGCLTLRALGPKTRPLSGKPLRLSGPPPGAGDRPQAAQVRPLGRKCLELKDCLSLYNLV